MSLSCPLFFHVTFTEVTLTCNQLHIFEAHIFEVLAYIYIHETMTTTKIRDIFVTFRHFCVPFLTLPPVPP